MGGILTQRVYSTPYNSNPTLETSDPDKNWHVWLLGGSTARTCKDCCNSYNGHPLSTGKANKWAVNRGLLGKA